jgi:uncharacterized protein (DUF1697 family)
VPRYVSFLRGVTPKNAKMAELQRAFEGAGFSEVRTVLASGNVVFDAPETSEAALVRTAEAAMARQLGRTFYTVVRPVVALSELIVADPFAEFALAGDAKRVVTFMREPHAAGVSLPIEAEGVRILASTGREVFTAYVPDPRGPVFMTLIEKAFGANVTTRTWDTVKKCAAA